LSYLVEHAGQLVTKEELLDALWPDTYVTDAVLKVYIGELRKALGDDPKTSRFIETAHRRGYRFIGEIKDQGSGIRDQGSDLRPQTSDPRPKTQDFEPQTSDVRLQSAIRHPPSTIRHPPSAIRLVGREAELAQLQRWLAKALAGERQVVFVTGEPGIGKTTVVEALLDRAAAEDDLWIARGQCLEHYGAGEAYMPVLEALGRLCRQSGERLIGLLARYAPTWLVQMPSLISVADRDRLQRETLGATRERMLREMAEAVEAVTAQTPLTLVLEDLHWSDYSTLDLISSLGRRREPARLLVIGTYRPVEVILSGHPLKTVKQELQLHGRCQELPLEFLAEEAVAQYLAERFPGHSLPAELARVIHQRTDGNPLFMMNVVDYFVAQGLIVQGEGRWQLRVALEEIAVGVPENIRQMIEKQIERLSSEQQRVLEAASIAGIDFSTTAVAAAVEADVIDTEERCQELARRHQFLQATGIGEMPDGTASPRYRFIHSLYQQVLYQRVAAGRRAQLHRRIGECAEVVYGRRAGEIAAELAIHFEQGRDGSRAVRYLRRAAENAARRYANREAIDCLTQALKLIERLPHAERAEVQMALLSQRGLVRRSMGEMKAAAEDFESLAAVARQQGQIDQEVKALLYLCSVLFWISRERCLEVVDEAIGLSRQLDDGLLRAHARGYCAHWNLNLRGWQEDDARAFVQALATIRQAGDRSLLSLHVARDCYFQCLRSDYGAACRAAEEGMQLTVEVGDAFDYLLCKFFWAWALLHRGRWGEMQQVLHGGIEMADKNGHHLWTSLFQMEIAWLHEQAFDFEPARRLCEPLIEQAQKAPHETGQLLFKSLIVLGLAHLGLGQPERAFACLADITHRLEREGIVMDWILHLPLSYGLSRCWLAQGDFQRARRAAERLCALAAQPGERTYLALARQTLADIAMAEQNWPQAEKELEQALVAVAHAEAPLAAWRVYATVARFHQEQGRNAEAAPYWRQSAAVLNRLADSLGEASALRQSLLTHPTARQILHRAQGQSTSQRVNGSTDH
jgi:DNA-binding winged helix-turn-helix (wHTH) protein/tetratricopeptide (TPR) repeat protein